MNILFISYWSFTEGLTQSTVIPNVKILSGFKKIKKIILVTIERDGLPEQASIHPKVIHYPIRSRSFPIPLLGKVIDFYRIPRILTELIRIHKIQKIIARGSPAGALAYLTWKKNKMPFYVESFEPHAVYMIETGVWKSWDPRYVVQKRWEKKQLKYAAGLMPVSKNYERELKSLGLSQEKIAIAPCAVDCRSFIFNKEDREVMRKKLRIGNRITGIYVGKFGGLYMNEEVFNILEALISTFKNFYLIIITPDPIPHIKDKLSVMTSDQFGFSVHHANHTDVVTYLSAADFGLALYKSFNSSQFLSPIKIGEYWANGLPVLLTNGVGDEYYYIEVENGGALFDVSNPFPACQKIEQILKSENYRSRIPELALKHRSFDQVTQAYRKLICPEIP